MSIVKKIKDTFVSPRFIKFVVTGGSLFIFDFTLFTIGVKAGLPTLLANSISVGLAIILNFIINRIWVFKSKNKNVGGEFGKFLGVQVFNFFMNNLFVIIFTQFALNKLVLSIINLTPLTSDGITSFLSEDDSNKMIAKILATSIQIVTSFVLYKFLVFKNKEN